MQPMNDPERMAIVLHQVEEALEQAHNQQKQVIFMTHFAPIREALLHPLIESVRRQRMWEMTTAMLGSEYLGALLARFPEVKAVFLWAASLCPAINYRWKYCIPQSSSWR